jgi:hypothetical protein
MSSILFHRSALVTELGLHNAPANQGHAEALTICADPSRRLVMRIGGAKVLTGQFLVDSHSLPHGVKTTVDRTGWGAIRRFDRVTGGYRPTCS